MNCAKFERTLGVQLPVYEAKLDVWQRNMVKSREIIPFVMIEAEESIGIDTE
jgi:hypothetical protein